jgi:uncharacterized protein YjbI with pentapeptide repeats
MANPEHLAILREGVEPWNQWRRKHPMAGPDFLRPDLSGANLSNLDRSTACPGEVVPAEMESTSMNLGSDDLDGTGPVDDDPRTRYSIERAFINTHLAEVDFSEANLSGASLYGALLIKTVLIKANLSAADLRRAALLGAYMSEADLSAAKLRRASLFGADLSHSDLTGADLSWADLLSSNLRSAILVKADFTKARVGGTTFADVDLSEVKGLESVVHGGPSSIGIDTIYKSKGKIPHAFLRGAGVPDNLIEYMASLVGTGIEFHSLFISYSTHDQAFAERLHNDLQAKGVRCWFAPHKLQGGKKVYRQIDEAIRVYDKLLLILSPASMESEWVRWEISNARTREIKEGKQVLFPIRLCPYDALRDWKCAGPHPGSDLAPEVREYFIPDFSNWKNHDAYKLAFDRLLKDLHGKPEPSSA